MILPGWTCAPPCSVFNGEGKAVQATCRACGASRPQLLTWQEARDVAERLIERKTRSYVADAMELARFVENGTRTHQVFGEGAALGQGNNGAKS